MANKVPTAIVKAHHAVYNLKSCYIAVKTILFALFSVSLSDFHHQTKAYSTRMECFPIYWSATQTALLVG